MKRTFLGLVFLAAPGVVQASPVVEGPAQKAWDGFLAGGVGLWSHAAPPPITPAVHSEMRYAVLHPTANTLDAEWVDYLLWRQSLNPTRFDHYHPCIALHLPEVSPPPPPPPALELPPVVTPPVVVPPSPVVTPPPPVVPAPGGEVTPPPGGGVVIETPTPPPFSSVPEPPTGWLASAGVFAVIMARRLWA